MDDEADTTQRYICYYCEEVIYFGAPEWQVPTWRHVETDEISCDSIATPSTISVLENEDLTDALRRSLIKMVKDD